MAEEERSSGQEKIRNLIRWNSTDAEAVATQLLERVREGNKQGLTMGVVACFVYEEEDGTRYYEPAFSTLPVEVSMWAANKIHRRIIAVNEGGE